MRAVNNVKNDYRFGREAFEDWLRDGWDSMYLSTSHLASFDLVGAGEEEQSSSRLDHGFAVFGILPWLTATFDLDDSEAYELAVISRTYLPEEVVRAAPEGLQSRIIPTSSAWWGEDDCGLPVVTWATHPTRASVSFLQTLRMLPATQLAYAMRGHGVYADAIGWSDVRLAWIPDHPVRDVEYPA
jgi:hypothetical protein